MIVAAPSPCPHCGRSDQLIDIPETAETIERLRGELLQVRDELIRAKALKVCCQKYDTCREPCVPREEHRLAATLEAKDKAERLAKSWEESAAQFCRNQEFYHGIVCQIGELFGVEAKTSDDGSVQDDVLALKVPELVAALKARLDEAEKDQRRYVWLCSMAWGRPLKEAESLYELEFRSFTIKYKFQSAKEAADAAIDAALGGSDQGGEGRDEPRSHFDG